MTAWTYNHSNNEPPGANGWATYENVIHNTVDYMLGLDNASINNVYFEIWNEPNSNLDAGVPIGKGFWPYDHPYIFKEHFMDTWTHAYNKIKEMHSDAKVVGPSFSGLYWSDMKQYFLNPAQSAEYQSFPDMISYHYPFWGAVNNSKKINYYLNNNELNVDGIIIGEYLPSGSRERGNLVYSLASFERASAKHANGAQILYSTLDPYSLPDPGLIGGTIGYGTDHYGGPKRGSWWILKKYTDMNENSTILQTQPDLNKNTKGDITGGLEVYATKDTNNTLKIILGTYTRSDNPQPFTGQLRINLENFFQGSKKLDTINID